MSKTNAEFYMKHLKILVTKNDDEILPVFAQFL